MGPGGARLGPYLLFLTALAGCHPGAGAAAAPATPAMGGGWQVVPAVPLVRQRGPADCGEAALEMVVRYWQPEASTDELRAALRPVTDVDGIPAGELRTVARQRGLAAFLVEGAPADLAHEVSLGRPVIVGLVKRVAHKKGLRHYEVVVGVSADGDRVLAADPQDGWRQVATAMARAKSRTCCLSPPASQVLPSSAARSISSPLETIST
jgi:ABC-type bacteriocin/lantibiotic exporter with double-glycine peptidase domain